MESPKLRKALQLAIEIVGPDELSGDPHIDLEYLIHEMTHMYLLKGSVHLDCAKTVGYEKAVSNIVQTRYAGNAYAQNRHECITSALTLLTLHKLGLNSLDEEIVSNAKGNMEWDLVSLTPSGWTEVSNWGQEKNNRGSFVERHIDLAINSKVNQKRASYLASLIS